MKGAQRHRILATASSLCLLASLASGQSSEPKEKQVTENQAASAAIEAIDAFTASQKIDKAAQDWKQKLPRPPAAEFDQGKTYYWQLETNLGEIKLRLLADVAPMHVTSTIYLTRLGFYDGTIFHRVISGFMAQGGDPTGTGRGGPGYKYDGEFSSKLKHERKGMLSMANAGPGTDGSQFFITFVATPHLDGRHTLFGEVVEGMGTLDELEKRGSPGGRPSERLEIRRATISVE
jgi:cyclophilin family peptidyl-prolyl cis-trans isomerase